jgi:predicted phage tail component-like protein
VRSFSFNGVYKDYVVATRIKRPTWAPIQRNILNISGYPGGMLYETETKPRIIPVQIFVKNDSFSDLEKLKEDLAVWLITENEAELIFDDEPDRLYFAVVDGSFNPEEIVNTGIGEFNFICLDPYKYGPEKKVQFEESKRFYVDGTVETDPVIRLEISQDTTFIAVSDGEKMNIVGQQPNVDQQLIVKEERKFWHQMDELSGWSDTISVEEGVITGTMKTTGYSFYTDDYGSDPAWHGPAKKISIGSTIQDFQVDALVHQSSTSGKAGSIEIALLDASNNFVAKMLLSKRSINSVANWARIRAGKVTNGYDIMNTRGANEITWANFDGLLRISRVGNVWTAYACLIDQNGVQHTRAGETWVDTYAIATAPISQIQVQIWQYGTVPTTLQYIADLKVFKINSPTDNQVPILARAGEIITFDHKFDSIKLSGVDITKEKAFIGEYFPLKPGDNTIIVEPTECIEKVEVTWNPKWL